MNARRNILVIAYLALAFAPLRAEQLLYSVDIPDSQVATYRVPIEVIHAGDLIIEGTWPTNRLLAFRVEPPAGAGAPVRKNSPSPIRLKIPITEDQLGMGPWTLVIHAIPLSGAFIGQVSVRLPEPAAPQRVMKTGMYKRPLQPWEESRGPISGLSSEQTILVQATESFRKLLVDVEQRAPDTCRWQDELLEWLAGQRDLVLDEGTDPDPATGKLMEQMAGAIRSVDSLRTSRDPILIGPPPADLRAWQRLRNDRLVRVEDQLDELLSAVSRNHAPELEGRQWPVRLVSCLTAAERYFDQRWVVGEERAPNRELAENQWQPFNRAAEALDALASMSAEDAIQLRTRRP